MNLKEKLLWFAGFAILATGINLSVFNRNYRPTNDNPYEILLEDDEGNFTEVTQQHVH